MKLNVFLWILLFLFIFDFSYGTDTILFTTGYSVINVDVGDKVDYNCDIANGGKIFLCPDAIDNYHFLTFRIGGQEITGADYYMKFPDTNTRNLYEQEYEMTGVYLFRKVRNGITYEATIEVFWLSCPDPSSNILGEDTLVNNSSASSYSIHHIQSDRYEWYVLPHDAGIISSQGVTADFQPSETFVGTATLYAIGVNGYEINGNDTISTIEITVQAPSVTDIASFQQELVQVFPNPATHVLHIANGVGYKTFSLYACDGRMVEAGKLLDNKIDVSNMEKGTYILQLFSEKDAPISLRCIIN